MLITQLTSYYPLGSVAGLRVPLWSLRDSVTIEIPNYRSQWRLKNDRHTSFTAISYPSSAIINAPDPDVMELPCLTATRPDRHWMPGRDSDVSLDIHPRYGTYLALFMRLSGAGGGTNLVRIEARIAIYSGICRLQMGRDPIYRYTPLSDGYVRETLSRSSWENVLSWGQLTRKTIGQIVEAMLNDWLLNQEAWSVSLTETVAAQEQASGSVMDATHLTAWAENILDSGLRFDEKQRCRANRHWETLPPALNPDSRGRVLLPRRKLTTDYLQKLWSQDSAELCAGKAQAFVEALKDFPKFAPNMLKEVVSAYQVLTHFAFNPQGMEDLFEGVETVWKRAKAPKKLKRLRALELPQIPGVARNAWFGGRYVWTTSIMDAESAWNYCYDVMLQWVGSRSNAHKCHGKAEVGSATYQCTFVVQEKALKGLSAFFEGCYKYGLEPNAYVLWDFVPYSFVIDWFFPIGTALESYDLANHFTPEAYDFLPFFGDDYSFCYSVKYSFATILGNVAVKSRWYEAAPPQVETSYFLLEPAHGSTKVQCWRVVDSIALIL